jgi:hypothetical protein
MNIKIPKSFKLFGTTINIVWDNNKMNDKSIYGEADYGSSKITLSTTKGTVELSEDRILDTYYHEKVHIILNTMHEDDLSSNEKFVDTFAKLLRQSDITSEYKTNI